jgi:hypothetical protein
MVGNNKTVNKAVKKDSAHSNLPIAQAVTKIFCWLQRQSKIDSTYINTHGNNKRTNDLSHTALHTWVSKLKTMSTHYLLDYTLLPQTKEHLALTLSYRHFLPSPDLMSTMLGAVLKPCAVTNLLSEPQHKDLGTSIRCQHHFYQFLSQAFNIHDVMLNRLKLLVTVGHRSQWHLLRQSAWFGRSSCVDFTNSALSYVRTGVVVHRR